MCIRDSCKCVLNVWFCITGDPVKFHAQYIVLCRDSSAQMFGSDLILNGRMGCSTRKTFVIASKDSDKEDDVINYLSFEWFSK